MAWASGPTSLSAEKMETQLHASRLTEYVLSQYSAQVQEHQQLSSLEHYQRIEDLIPRKQFIVDLQAWIESLIADQHKIILTIDANKGTYDTQGSYTPLQYQPLKPTPTQGHDGSLARTCGLSDPLLLHHPGERPPPTYNREKERIDYILVSNNIIHLCLRSGILPYDSIFSSDHRACFINTDKNGLFNGNTPTIAPPQYRGLRTSFCSKPLQSYFGYTADKTGAQKLIEGNLPPECITNDLLPETKSVLKL
jgi:hypothetical protein